MNKVEIPFLENPDSVYFDLPEGIPHHVMIKDVSDNQDDILYYHRFISRTYDKYLMTYETGEDGNNPHYHIIGFNNESKNKFSNFKRGNAKLRKATEKTTKYSELRELLEKHGLTPTHIQVYYVLKEQELKDTVEKHIWCNYDNLPVCVNGYRWIMSQLPENIKKKTKLFKSRQEPSFLSKLIHAYPHETVDVQYWNDDNKDIEAVRCAIYNHCLSFCTHWNITQPCAKNLAKKNFKDYCYTVWMQYYATPIHNDYETTYIEVWGNHAF